MRTIKELEQAVGGLSQPSKMPGLSYGTPAAACKVGSILRAAGKHTVCGSCYAHKGMYVFPNVRNAQAKRLEILSSDLDQWRQDMTELIRLKYRRKAGKDRVFRFHDSGDVQSLEHLEAIVQIARDLPDILFWLPTKQYPTVRQWLAQNSDGFPSNLAVRVSAPMIGRPAVPIPGTVSSTVSAGVGYSCPAPQQGNNCGDCRACWSTEIASVDYHKH